MVGRGVVAPRAWGQKRAPSRFTHRTGCISALSHNKKGSGVPFRLLERRLNLDRTVPHPDNFLPWLIVCVGAEFKESEAGVGKNLCNATVKPPAVLIAFSAIPRLAVPMALCARVRETVAQPCPLGGSPRHGPSWCGRAPSMDRGNPSNARPPRRSHRSHRTACVVSDAKTFFVGPE